MSLTPSVDYRSLFITRPSLSKNSLDLVQRQISLAEAAAADKQNNQTNNSTNKQSKKRSREEANDSSPSSSPLPPPSSTASAFSSPSFSSSLLTFSRSNFRSYFYYLRRGFNLLFYGFGSKKQLLTEFARSWLSDGPIVIVNGYNSQLNIKFIMSLIIEKILQLDSQISQNYKSNGIITKNNPENQLAFLTDYFTVDHCHSIPFIYIMIHNLDSFTLRSFAIQHFLSRLAALKRIHLIASVDELGSSIILNNGEIWNKYGFLTIDATTYQPYQVELPCLSIDNEAANVQEIVRGIEFTLSSLTPSHRKILQILAQHKLDSQNGEEEGLQFQEYLDQSENAMAVTGDAGFRSLLHELLDHQLITRKVVKGREMYQVPFSTAIIRQKICPTEDQTAAKKDEKDSAPVVIEKKKSKGKSRR
jgi:origin recognition complex subunit 2